MALLCDNYFPFATGPGAGASQASWQKMARIWSTNGVFLVNGNQLNAHASGGNLYIDSGGCWIEGFYGELLNDNNVVDTTLGSTNPNGLLVMRLDFAAATISAVYKPGTNVSTTQILGGIFEIPIAQISTGAISQDLRTFVQTSTIAAPAKLGQALQSQNVTAPSGTFTTAGFTINQAGTYLVSVGIQMNDAGGLGGSALQGQIKLLRAGKLVQQADIYNLNVTGQKATIVKAVHCDNGDLLQVEYLAFGSGTVTFASAQDFCTISGGPFTLPVSTLPTNVSPASAGFPASGQLLVQSSGGFLQILSYTSIGSSPAQFGGISGGTPGAVINNGAGVNDPSSDSWFQADWMSQA